MKTTRFVHLSIVALLMSPVALHAAKTAGKPAGRPSSTPEPSAQLRQLIDTTLPRITNISNPKQRPIDRTKLIEAQADYTARAQTAPPAEQPMYKAAMMVVANLVGAVDEHEKAVATYTYSNNLHGKQDREDSKVSNWQRGRGQGRAAEADNAKQKMENADSRKALLDKEQFMSNGNAASWTQRVGQLHEIVEQSLTAELVAEKQLAMLTPPAPPPVPVSKPTPKPVQPSSADKYSPVGTWKGDNGMPLTLKEDNTATRGKRSGTWNWTNQSKGNLHVAWPGGLSVDLNFPADGHALSGKNSNGVEVSFTRDK